MNDWRLFKNQIFLSWWWFLIVLGDFNGNFIWLNFYGFNTMTITDSCIGFNANGIATLTVM